ncbi:MAG: DUF2179 domain-containing protein [Phycisphaerales bacterium]
MPDWLIPILIFSARICDVSIGTLRMIMVISGHRFAAVGLGFVEVLVWVLAVGGVVTGGFDNPWNVLAFAGGYATGTLVGMTIESKIALGYRVVRVINKKRELDLGQTLESKGWSNTRIDGRNGNGDVEVLFFTLKRKRVPVLLEELAKVAPDAFTSVERAERVSGYVDVLGKPSARMPWGRFGNVIRK